MNPPNTILARSNNTSQESNSTNNAILSTDLDLQKKTAKKGCCPKTLPRQFPDKIIQLTDYPRPTITSHTTSSRQPYLCPFLPRSEPSHSPIALHPIISSMPPPTSVPSTRRIEGRIKITLPSNQRHLPRLARDSPLRYTHDSHPLLGLFFCTLFFEGAFSFFSALNTGAMDVDAWTGAELASTAAACEVAATCSCRKPAERGAFAGCADLLGVEEKCRSWKRSFCRWRV